MLTKIFRKDNSLTNGKVWPTASSLVLMQYRNTVFLRFPPWLLSIFVSPDCRPDMPASFAHVSSSPEELYSQSIFSWQPHKNNGTCLLTAGCFLAIRILEESVLSFYRRSHSFQILQLDFNYLTKKFPLPLLQDLYTTTGPNVYLPFIHPLIHPPSTFH